MIEAARGRLGLVDRLFARAVREKAKLLAVEPASSGVGRGLLLLRPQDLRLLLRELLIGEHA